MIYNTEEELKLGQTAQDMKETMPLEGNTVLEPTNGMMGLNTLAIGRKTKYLE